MKQLFYTLAGVVLCSIAFGIGDCSAQTLSSLQLEGYTEPIEVIDVALDESGTVSEVCVHEGDFVSIGEPLVRLNSELVDAQIELARQQQAATGRIRAARAEEALTSQRLEKLRLLQQTGHARQSELARAIKEADVARANLISVQEDLEAMRLDHQRLVTQRSRRTARAPIDGVVTAIHRHVGEFVAPNKPEVITVVNLDRLVARFAVGESEARSLKPGARAKLELIDEGHRINGKIAFVSPVTDAESGTVLIKVEFENPEMKFRGGSRCRLIETE